MSTANTDLIARVPGLTASTVGSLPCIDIATPLCKGRVFLQGAHVAAFEPKGQRPVLWMSERSWFEPGKPIRGGIPICFPWFGQSGPAGAPAHGFARLRSFELTSAELTDDGAVRLCLSLMDDAEGRALYPHSFRAELRATFSETLELAFRVVNMGQAEMRHTEALHTYFAVSDVRHVAVRGLAGAPYSDHVGGITEHVDGDEAIRFVAETDRVYTSKSSTMIEDPGFGRRIIVEKSGSDSTVVWNPWIAKAARMPDYGDDEWPGMVCIETANARASVVTLAPGAAHELALRLVCAAM
jgi:glucose-6-phosphate 1-epimerase